jgi:hypothetical protein
MGISVAVYVGGRDELSVVGPFDVDQGEGPYVEVRFSSAHDYELVPEEGPVEQQKRIPGGRGDCTGCLRGLCWTWRCGS